MTYALTQHAAVRTQQRGVPHHLIDALMSYADFEAPVGGGCTVLRMSRARLEDPDLADRLGAERGLSALSGRRNTVDAQRGRLTTRNSLLMPCAFQ